MGQLSASSILFDTSRSGRSSILLSNMYSLAWIEKRGATTRHLWTSGGAWIGRRNGGVRIDLGEGKLMYAVRILVGPQGSC